MADNTTNERAELKVITNWKEFLLEGNEVTLDLTEDAWEFAAPPPRNVYDVKCFLAKEGLKFGLLDKNDPKSIYINIGIEGKIVSTDEDINGIPVFPFLSTRVYPRRNISTAASFLVKLGYKVPNPITDKKLAMYVEAALKKEPIIKTELDWKGSYSYKDAKTGKDVWENVYNHYEEFPVDDKGERRHLISVASKGGGMVEIRAQLKVNRFFGKNDPIPTFSKGTKLVSAPKSLQPQRMQEPTPELAPTPSFVSPPVQPVQQTMQVSTEEEDLNLMLETQ
jgi:hypothetical protein